MSWKDGECLHLFQVSFKLEAGFPGKWASHHNARSFFLFQMECLQKYIVINTNSVNYNININTSVYMILVANEIQ